MWGKTSQSLNQDAKDIINFKALSKALTGSETKIRKNNTAKKYASKIKELEEYINLWITWNKEN